MSSLLQCIGRLYGQDIFWYTPFTKDVKHKQDGGQDGWSRGLLASGGGIVGCCEEVAIVGQIGYVCRQSLWW